MIANGEVHLEDGRVQVDEIAYGDGTKKIIGIQIHEGRNRIVRRLFEHLGYVVEKLDRTMYAGLTKKDLPRGHWRFLTEKEIIRLKFKK
jgi:23S rRNA pseudouridine2605 synthase